jgi:Fe-S-cluster-containing dehydrogenase component
MNLWKGSDMATQDRRQFIRSALALGAGAAALAPAEAKAAPENTLDPDRYGVLVDTTVCIGCRRCEWACKTAHDMPTDDIHSYDDRSVLSKQRRPNPASLTVVNEYPGPHERQDKIDVKAQCMHCDHPACVSACIVGAFSKKRSGEVLWDGGLCIGCRYCMVACPFQIPTFEFDKAIEPRIMKCDLCSQHRSKTGLPACVDVCPMEALTYGKRSDLVEVARSRMKIYPDRYYQHLYGEFEVGGTSWLYLTPSDPTGYAFPKLTDKPAPGVSESIQHGIFAYFVPPVALYALLGLVMWINKNRSKHTEEEA